MFSLKSMVPTAVLATSKLRDSTGSIFSAATCLSLISTDAAVVLSVPRLSGVTVATTACGDAWPSARPKNPPVQISAVPATATDARSTRRVRFDKFANIFTSDYSKPTHSSIDTAVSKSSPGRFLSELILVQHTYADLTDRI